MWWDWYFQFNKSWHECDENKKWHQRFHSHILFHIWHAYPFTKPAYPSLPYFWWNTSIDSVQRGFFCCYGIGRQGLSLEKRCKTLKNRFEVATLYFSLPLCPYPNQKKHVWNRSTLWQQARRPIWWNWFCPPMRWDRFTHVTTKTPDPNVMKTTPYTHLMRVMFAGARMLPTRTIPDPKAI